MKRFIRIAAILMTLSATLFAFGTGEAANEPRAPSTSAEPKAGAVQDNRSEERNALVDSTIVARGVTDPLVIRAMRSVPRHRFVPDELSDRAYRDSALPIGYGQTISQPYVVAFMTEALRIEPGNKVLEIGTGSGYQAAVLAELAREVYSIEIVPELGALVEKRLRGLGYESIGLKVADGYYGWEEEAPFDRMMVTAAVDHVPPPLLRQLAANGRLILPLGSPGGIQTLLLIVKHADGSLERHSLLAVRFVPMTGRALQ